MVFLTASHTQAIPFSKVQADDYKRLGVREPRIISQDVFLNQILPALQQGLEPQDMQSFQSWNQTGLSLALDRIRQHVNMMVH